MRRVALLILLALPAYADPCREAFDVTAADVAKGLPVPCAGTLVPAGEARRCLECLRAEVPVAVADAVATRVELVGERETAAADRTAAAVGVEAQKPCDDPPSRGAWYGAGALSVVIVEVAAILVIAYVIP